MIKFAITFRAKDFIYFSNTISEAQLYLYDKTIIEFGFRMVSRFIQASVKVTWINLDITLSQSSK